MPDPYVPDRVPMFVDPRLKRGIGYGLQPNPGFYDPNGGRLRQGGLVQDMPNFPPGGLKPLTPADLHRDEQSFQQGNQYLQPVTPPPASQPALDRWYEKSPDELRREANKRALQRSLLSR